MPTPRLSDALSPTHVAALEYARRGWHVFPVEPPRPGDPKSGKAPLVELVPRGKDDATTDPSTIAMWWLRCPSAGVGIACAPSNLVVLDVDIGEGKGGAQSLGELESEIELTATMTAVTGGGGLHAYYLADPSLPAFQKIRFRPGLDLIGKGYVVAPPSSHASGGSYRWSDSRTPSAFPAGLAAVALAKKTPANISSSVEVEKIPAGQRNDALFRLACVLRDTGVGEDALKAAIHFENQRRFTPPLDDEEVRRVAESAMRTVQPTRDVALGALIESVARESVAVATRATWVRDVAARDAPPVRFYATGFPQLDALLGGGLCSRQVCGVVGPPSAGKSAFVGSVARHLQQSVPVLHVSTELQNHEMAVRYAALELGFPWRDGIKGLIPRERMRGAVADVSVKIVGCDDLDRSDPLAMIRAEAVALAAERGQPPVIIIDYVQLLARGSDDTLRQRVGELTMQIRIMSQQLDCPIVAVFSTRRDFYGGGALEKLRQSDDPTVFLAAAKESGDIEFDCATILYLDVDKLHEGQPKPARVAVARCRVGDIGFVGCRAQLDVGKWWGDPAATAEITSEERLSKRNVVRADLDVQRVYDLVQRMPGRPWGEVRNATGFGRDRADAARARLIEAGRLEYVTEVYYDAMHRITKRHILKAVGNKLPVPDAEGTPES